jgi:xanthine dehydrogenase large subunit
MKAVPHESARGHVTGEALYTDDLVGRFPNLVHAWPVMAPHAHALLLHLDAAPALEEPGVIATLTGADAPGEANSGANRHDEPLFPTEILHHRQPVAWVLGESLEAARNGAARVLCEYRALPPILTIQDAIAAQSYHSGPLRIAHGDAASAIAGAPHRVTAELAIGGQEHFYLETQCALARFDETGGILVDSSTQHPTETQEIVARVLGIERNRVTVQCLRMGGAFGGKEVQANPWAAIAALGTWKTGRPVRVRLPRNLDMALSGKRHPFWARYTVGFEPDGRLAGLEAELYSDGGWSLDLSEPVLWRALFHCDNAYLLPALDATGYVCKTHKTSQTAFRGFGGPQGMLVIEDALDRIARTLGLPAHEVRERNFYRAGDVTHYGQTVKDAARILTIWNRLQETSGFQARRAEVAAFNRAHRHAKRGIAITPVKFGISFTATFFNQAGALVLVYRDGSVQVNHGGTEMGQGLYTKTRQIAAHALGVPLETVRAMPTRTDKVPNTAPTAASAGTDLNGAAVLDACRQIMERLQGVPGASFVERVEAAYRQRVPLFAQGFYRTPDIHFDPKTATGKPFHYFAYGAAVSEVEIDGFTGEHRILRADLLEDVGDSFSPLIDRGQIEGGFVQGLGWLTLEELLWDSQGRLATAGASTYKLPSWPELPEVFEVAFLERATEPGVVFGSKAVGEPPLMLAISVREAIREAVAAFGSGGVVALDSPATPERIFWAVRAQRERAEFVARFGGVFEDSPWVAERSWELGSLRSAAELHARMVGVMEAAGREEQWALLRAHPDLGSRARMSDSSVAEQAGAGLDRLNAEEFERLHRLNAAYKTKFGFPFLYAVKGSGKAEILEALERRLESGAEAEFAEALRQVARIAWFRLQALIPETSPNGSLSNQGDEPNLSRPGCASAARPTGAVFVRTGGPGPAAD